MRSMLTTLSLAVLLGAAPAAAQTKPVTPPKKPVVTETTPLVRFWKAETYHQQYDEKTGTHSCPLPRGLTPEG